MKKKNIFLLIIFLAILAVAFFFALGKFFPPKDNLESVYSDFPADPAPLICSLEGCHGLEASCGSEISPVCPEIYQSGDSCRKYVRCEIFQGKCQMVDSENFNRCRSCVLDCQAEFKEMPEVFECERRCHLEINGGEGPELE